MRLVSETLVGVLLALGANWGDSLSQAIAGVEDATLPRFEVTSVKPNTSGAAYVGAAGDRFSNGQYRATNIPLRLVMRQAFGRWRSDDVIRGPGWLDTERWDIAAKAESPDADMLPMIRGLLADRFGVRAHIETAEGPLYALVLARRDGRLGPSLHAAIGESSSLGATGHITGRAIPIGNLAEMVGYEVRRKVVDRTKLEGTYDVELRFAPISGGGTPDAAKSPDVPDIFTAMQEQLGLRLEATRGPVDTLVVDAARRPDPD